MLLTSLRQVVHYQFFVCLKVRSTVRLFRKSPVRNDDSLQPFVISSHGKELQLLLDTKTRWNSLLAMLQRFYHLRKEIKMAMVHLEKDFPFTDEELQAIKELSEILEPVEIAVKRICEVSFISDTVCIL